MGRPTAEGARREMETRGHPQNPNEQAKNIQEVSFINILMKLDEIVKLLHRGETKSEPNFTDGAKIVSRPFPPDAPTPIYDTGSAIIRVMNIYHNLERLSHRLDGIAYNFCGRSFIMGEASPPSSGNLTVRERPRNSLAQLNETCGLLEQISNMFEVNIDILSTATENQSLREDAGATVSSRLG